MVIITGDIHGEWGKLNALINKKKPDILIVCGDFGYWPAMWDLDKIVPAETKILWCDGNHEDFWALKQANPEVVPGVFYMKRGSVYTLPDNRKVLFMGGASSTDKEMRTFGVDWFPEETISWADMEDLPDHRIDIVISHTCPNEFYKQLSSLYSHNDPSRVALSYVLEKYRPLLWYFGHFHAFRKGKFEDTHWTALNMAGSTGWWVKL
jgi:hypothetical protein